MDTSGALALLLTTNSIYILNTVGGEVYVNNIHSSTAHSIMRLSENVIVGEASGKLMSAIFTRADGANDVYGVIPVRGDWTIA
jgi:hypothetical protein